MLLLFILCTRCYRILFHANLCQSYYLWWACKQAQLFFTQHGPQQICFTMVAFWYAALQALPVAALSTAVGQYRLASFAIRGVSKSLEVGLLDVDTPRLRRRVGLHLGPRHNLFSKDALPIWTDTCPWRAGDFCNFFSTKLLSIRKAA